MYHFSKTLCVRERNLKTHLSRLGKNANQISNSFFSNIHNLLFKAENDTNLIYIIPLYFPISSHLELLNILLLHLSLLLFEPSKRGPNSHVETVENHQGVRYFIVSWVMEFLNQGYKISSKLSKKNEWASRKITVFCADWLCCAVVRVIEQCCFNSTPDWLF